VVEIKCFILISLMEQTLFQVILIDIGTKLLLDRSGGNGECNMPNTIFAACFSPSISECLVACECDIALGRYRVALMHK